jgi:nucleoside-diphosphate-sugar epimerase
MKILVTGYNGYIGSVMVPFLQNAGHEVVGLDSFLYEGCHFSEEPPAIPSIRVDVRQVEPEHFLGFDAVIALAALSNDPLGNLNAQTTYAINHYGVIRTAKAAKKAGVKRFLFASSCSLYGAGPQDFLDETAPFNPVTPYGESKIRCEFDLIPLADENFSPTFMRCATAYGFSPRLRSDLVVNDLTGLAHLTGQIAMKSDGMPWRPFVHIEDISRAFLAALEAPRERVHLEALNVGQTGENYRVREVAQMVAEVVPGSVATFSDGAEPDIRNYRVNCDKIRAVLPEFKPVWTVRKGIEQLYHEYRRNPSLTLESFKSSRFMRIKRIKELQAEGKLDEELYWKEAVQS